MDAYSNQANLSVYINSKILNAEYGLVNYKFKVTALGKNILRIILKYKDFQGDLKTDTVNINYEVDK